MDFHARPPEPAPSEPALAAALGARPQEVHRARDLVAVFGSQQEVEALRPDVQALVRIDAFAATAPGRESDLVSRFFAPRAGVPEDPVTGSSQCTLVSYWSRRLGKKKLHALQVSSRRGELFCEDLGARVKIAGRAVECLRGHIIV